MFPKVDSEDISQVTSLHEQQSLSSDVQNSQNNTEVPKQSNNRELTVTMLFLEVIFCIALALSTYGTLHNISSKVSKHPQAVRFFKSNSVVTDWYRGQLGSALAAANIADVSFIMYYAPWDAESQYVRGEFELAANVLSGQVHFSAINCWNPGSECRLQHSKIPSWPILMAYTVNSRGVLYKGPRDAHSMVKFLELIMKPMERVSSTEDLVNLLSIYDAVAVGYTPLSDTSRYFNIWYNVALKSREFDTVGEICFAVVTSADLAVDLGVEHLPNARLMLWNDTKEFKVEGDKQSWNESSLMHWVLENFSQPVARIIPMWKKSFSFDRYAHGNPMLLLFTPLNPLYEQLPSYALLREVAMEYYNCKNNDSSQWITELMKLQQVQRLIYQQKDFFKFCQEYKFKKPMRKPIKLLKKEVVSHNNKYPWWNNVTQKNQKNGVFDFILKQGLTMSKAMESGNDNPPLWSSLGMLNECSTKFLPAEKSFYENYEQCQLVDENVNKEPELNMEQENFETTMLPYEDDPLSPENLIQENIKHFCRLMQFAKQMGPPISPAKVMSGNITHIHGLSCASNSSLHMIAVDSIQNHHFAEALGIDILRRKDMTAVAILDSKHGSQYVLSEDYSAKSIRDFIYNFTRSNLKRSLRTHVADAAYTHYYDSDTTDVDIHITDLTSRTFRKFVRTPGTVSLVCVCGGSCGAAAARALAGAARLLRRCGLRARPARLDAARHDPPAHYDVHAHPALLVVVADSNGEADSSAYPAGERVSASGLAALALRRLPASRHLRLRLALCSAQANIQKKACLKDLREHTTTLIGRNLKYWRRTDVRELKDSLFKRLQHLNQVSLYLSLLHTTDLEESNEKQKLLLDSIEALTSVWNIDNLSMLRKNATTSSRTR